MVRPDPSDPRYLETGRCIFCGRGPLHLEDAAPVWLLKEIEEKGGGPPGITYAWFGPDGEPKTWHGPKIKARVVCQDRCNGGWMSVLENQAKPVMTPLLGDWALPRDRAEQRILARWCIKTAMVLATLSPHQQSPFTQAEREAIAADQIPFGFHVWIGRHAVSNELFHGARLLFNPVTVDPTKRTPLEQGYVTTLGLGKVVLQLLHLRFRETPIEHHTLHTRPGPWDRSLRKIWPTETSVVRWPPPVSFSAWRTTVEDLDERFAGWSNASA